MRESGFYWVLFGVWIVGSFNAIDNIWTIDGYEEDFTSEDFEIITENKLIPPQI